MNSLKPDTLVLIDAHALIHRSFHAIPTLTHRGQLVNAVYGFAATILHVLEELEPEHLAVCFDEKGPTFRHEDFAAYKAHRPPTPEELSSQFPIARDLVQRLGIPLFSLAGYEADDLIGTLATQAEKAGVDVLIVTGDHDSYQLVNDHVKVYNVSRGIKAAEIIDAAAVQGRYGFGPERMLDYKALRGDASDGIPGVPGVGEKTAKVLISQFGSLEELYDLLDCGNDDPKLEGVSPKLRQKLCDHAETAFLSKKLATICRDAPIELDLDATRVKHYDEEGAHILFKELGFRSLVSRLPKAEPRPAAPSNQQSLFQ